MKKISTATLSEIIRKNKLLVAVFSLILMIAAAFSSIFCEKEIAALDKKWRSLYGIEKLWGGSTNKAATEGRSYDPRRYDIQIRLKRFAWSRVKIRFCDQYIFSLSERGMPPGVYYKKGQGPKKYVSTVKWPFLFLWQQRTAARQRLKDFHLRLKCDLVEKTVLVYVNGKLIEKVPLGPEPLKYSFILTLPPGRRKAMLEELKIADSEGRVLCDVNFAPLLFYKRISQAFLFLGALILLSLGVAQPFSFLTRFAEILFKKALLFVRLISSAILSLCDMIKFSVASLSEIALRNKSRTSIYSLLIMVASSFSILSCDEGIRNLETKWRSLYESKEVWGYEDNKAMAEGQSPDLRRYDVKVSLTQSVSRMIEIRFCDRYSFDFSLDARPLGVYYKTRQGQKKYVSTAKYPPASLLGVMQAQQRMVPQPPVAVRQRSENFRLHLKCDLVEKTVLVYMGGKFMEKIRLGPEPLKYRLGVGIPPGRKEVMLNELKISDAKGRVLFSVNFFPLSFFKIISQVFFFTGVLIFFFLACSERRFFRKALFFVPPLVFLEAFLRVACPHDPGLDIARLKPKWQFEISTNLFGRFNDPKMLTLQSPSPSTYLIANPEHATRILCVGSSPLVVGASSAAGTFSAILEEKLNSRSGNKYEVIPIVIPSTECLYSVEINIYMREVLRKISPDLVVFYNKLGSDDGVNEAQLEKDYAFYQRAKRVMEKNSDWIKNDRLLYAALEFKEPVKEIVYLYDFLCNSYLFMAVENIRKRFPGEWYSADRGTLAESPDSIFEEVLTLCKEKGIKVVFIPQLEFVMCLDDARMEDSLANLRRKHPEIYYLNLEGIFDKNKRALLGIDASHPSEFGHQVIAEELYRQLTEKGLLKISERR